MTKPTIRPGQQIIVQIDRLSVGGRGVARHQGIVIFVPDTAPQDEVLIELSRVKKNFAEGRLIEVIHPSPARVTPSCIHAGVCGGCNWQHVSYEEQLHQKRQLVRESLQKFSGFDISNPLVAETRPSPLPFRYRNRIQVHHAKGRLGFHQRSSHHIIDIDDCLIAEEKIIALLADLKNRLSHSPPGRVELLVSSDGRATTRKSNEPVLPSHEASELEIAHAFSQVNTEQNRHLVQYVVDTFVKELGTEVEVQLLDLYAGNGNFTFPLARALPRAEIGSAELNQENVIFAQETAQKEFTDRKLNIKCQDVFDFLKHASVQENSAVLLDPPRTGCAPEVMQELLKQLPALIVYVSCHPVTLARDLKPLADRYSLISVQPFDMFPQTDHVEVVAFLRRKQVDGFCGRT